MKRLFLAICYIRLFWIRTRLAATIFSRDDNWLSKNEAVCLDVDVFLFKPSS
jgi:hypothetical protein